MMEACRRLPKARQAAADQTIQEMRDAGIIEPSESVGVTSRNGS